jgi:hypothetical protein
LDSRFWICASLRRYLKLRPIINLVTDLESTLAEVFTLNNLNSL